VLHGEIFYRINASSVLKSKRISSIFIILHFKVEVNFLFLIGFPKRIPEITKDFSKFIYLLMVPQVSIIMETVQMTNSIIQFSKSSIVSVIVSLLGAGVVFMLVV